MRINSNASMIVDDGEMITTSGQNQGFTVFNSQSTIEIGGKLDILPNGEKTILRPFKGKILGLKFNNLRVLERARKNNSNVSLKCFFVEICWLSITKYCSN
jgi:hypothetical protein